MPCTLVPALSSSARQHAGAQPHLIGEAERQESLSDAVMGAAARPGALTQASISEREYPSECTLEGGQELSFTSREGK